MLKALAGFVVGYALGEREGERRAIEAPVAAVGRVGLDRRVPHLDRHLGMGSCEARRGASAGQRGEPCHAFAINEHFRRLLSRPRQTVWEPRQRPAIVLAKPVNGSIRNLGQHFLANTPAVGENEIVARLLGAPYAATSLDGLASACLDEPLLTSSTRRLGGLAQRHGGLAGLPAVSRSARSSRSCRAPPLSIVHRRPNLSKNLTPVSFLQNTLSEVNFPAPGGCT